MSLFRITHIDAQRTRRRMCVRASNCRQALHMVEQQFGDAWFTSAVQLKGGAA